MTSPLKRSLAVLAIFIAGCAFGDELKVRVVVSGFEPFQGRKQNASFVLATALKAAAGDHIELVEVPVVWGQPGKIIDQVTRSSPVDLWIAFGEGKNSALWIESQAYNQRSDSQDNLKEKPAVPLIQPSGPEKRSIDDQTIKSLITCLRKQGLTAKFSSSAGRYLCEEMLYELLARREGKQPTIRNAIFIHLPVLGGPYVDPEGHAQPLTPELCVQLGSKLMRAILVSGWTTVAPHPKAKAPTASPNGGAAPQLPPPLDP